MPCPIDASQCSITPHVEYNVGDGFFPVSNGDQLPASAGGFGLIKFSFEICVQCGPGDGDGCHAAFCTTINVNGVPGASSSTIIDSACGGWNIVNIDVANLQVRSGDTVSINGKLASDTCDGRLVKILDPFRVNILWNDQPPVDGGVT